MHALGGFRVGGGAAARLYVTQAPNETAFPHGILDLHPRAGVVGYGGLKDVGEVSVTLYDTERGSQWALAAMADQVEQALFQYRAEGDAAGVLYVGHVRRTDPLVPGDPMLRGTVMIRLAAALGVWPSYRLSLVTP